MRHVHALRQLEQPDPIEGLPRRYAERLDDDETPIRVGHVISRPAATGVAHQLRAGDDGLVFLAYGTREPNDVCWYPRSGKIAWCGIGVIGRLEPLDYWDGED